MTQRKRGRSSSHNHKALVCSAARRRADCVRVLRATTSAGGCRVSVGERGPRCRSGRAAVSIWGEG
eukprot:4997476-Prymnesium_polylepis.2